MVKGEGQMSGHAQLAPMMSALTVASKASPGKRGLLGRTSRMPDELSEPAAGFAASVTESALEVATTVPPYLTFTSAEAEPALEPNQPLLTATEHVASPDAPSAEQVASSVELPVSFSSTTRPVWCTALLPLPSRSCTATITLSRSFTPSLAAYTVAVRSTTATAEACGAAAANDADPSCSLPRDACSVPVVPGAGAGICSAVALAVA